MPCYQPEESRNEKESRRIANLILILDKKLGVPSAPEVVEWSKEIFKDYSHILAPVLCLRIRTLTPEQMDAIVYNGRDKESRMLADWWDEHDAFDKSKEK